MRYACTNVLTINTGGIAHFHTHQIFLFFMTLQLLTSKDDGIAQAWAMATLGSLASRRRAWRKAVVDISIPQTCTVILSSPNNTLPLRVSSNLLYGMSLIYKQKVTYMFNDVVAIYSRLCAPLFSNVPTEPALATVAAKTSPSKQYLMDDAKFSIDEDFAPDLDLDLPDAMDMILRIKQQDHELNQIDPASIPFAEQADARDRLFQQFVDKSFSTSNMEIEEEDSVGFEFDHNGDIVGHLASRAILEDVGFDEDFQAVSGTAADFSKAHNSGTNDPHFSTTANQTNEKQETARKRRRVRFVKDLVLTLDLERWRPLVASDQTRNLTIQDILELQSRENPQFVNSCNREIFGRVLTLSVPYSRYPLTRRHPKTAKTLNSFFNNFEEIEEGRNYASLNYDRASAEIRRGQDFPEENLFDFPFEIDMPNLSNISDEEIVEADRGESDHSRMLAGFLEFVHSKLDSLDNNVVTFADIVPSQAFETERPVNRKFAASAFALVLQLADKSQLQIHTPVGNSQPFPNFYIMR